MPTAKIKKKQTPAQALASKENWARLQLKNIQGQIQRLKYQGLVLPYAAVQIEGLARTAESRIVEMQRARMELAKQWKGKKL